MAGTTTPWNNGLGYDVYTNAKGVEGDHNLDLVGWSTAAGASGGRKVGLLAPNAWGLYDMHGNVVEWCLDYCYAGSTTSGRTGTEPKGRAIASPTTSSARVVKGGCYSSYWTSFDGDNYKHWRGCRPWAHVRMYNGNADDYRTCRITLRNSMMK